MRSCHFYSFTGTMYVDLVILSPGLFRIPFDVSRCVVHEAQLREKVLLEERAKYRNGPASSSKFERPDLHHRMVNRSSRRQRQRRSLRYCDYEHVPQFCIDVSLRLDAHLRSSSSTPACPASQSTRTQLCTRSPSRYTKSVGQNVKINVIVLFVLVLLVTFIILFLNSRRFTSCPQISR